MTNRADIDQTSLYIICESAIWKGSFCFDADESLHLKNWGQQTPDQPVHQRNSIRAFRLCSRADCLFTCSIRFCFFFCFFYNFYFEIQYTSRPNLQKFWNKIIGMVRIFKPFAGAQKKKNNKKKKCRRCAWYAFSNLHLISRYLQKSHLTSISYAKCSSPGELGTVFVCCVYV